MFRKLSLTSNHEVSLVLTEISGTQSQHIDFRLVMGVKKNLRVVPDKLRVDMIAVPFADTKREHFSIPSCYNCISLATVYRLVIH